MDSLGPNKITDLSTPYCSPIKDLLIPQKFLEIGRSQHKLWPLKLNYENRPDLEKKHPLIAHAFCQKMDSLGPKKITDLSTLI